MQNRKRTFETRGPVDPERNYVVPRETEIADLVSRIKQGRYIVIFAPRQTGKTTFFRWALSRLTAEDDTYFSIQLDFEIFVDTSVEQFYTGLQREIHAAIQVEFQRRNVAMAPAFSQLLQNASLRSHSDLPPFFEQLASYLEEKKVAIIIDEFDGIPQDALRGFLHTLRRIYLSTTPDRCPHSVGIVGIKSITQLSYDRSISPFNIQDEFALSNFTLSQVRALFGQYREEVGQTVAEEVIESIHKQTAGQPFLVNRMAQILTEEMDILQTETISSDHFNSAHKQILHERNVNISHLVTNIRRDKRFESVLWRIALKEQPISFNLDNEIISELTTVGVLVPDSEENCRIQNPIYQYRIVRAFMPLFNGLEDDYLPEDTDAGFFDYLTSDGKINMRPLLANFRDFIVRAGYRILSVPETPQEFIGQNLLFGYLDAFVRAVSGFMYLEVRTGRGRMDLIILHKGEKYIVETKIWEGPSGYDAGKRQLAAYLKLEGTLEGYLVVFDHRQKPEMREEEEVIEEKTIVSILIPVVQQRPSDAAKSET